MRSIYFIIFVATFTPNNTKERLDMKNNGKIEKRLSMYRIKIRS